MKTIYFSLIILLSVAACSESSQQTVEEKSKELLENFKRYEDSLGVMGQKSQITNSTSAVAYAEKCISVAEQIPKSKEAPKLLDKAHMIFCNFNMHRRSLAPAQMLIEKYPSYKNRPMVIQSVASAYDLFILPRQKDQAKKYYKMYLSEYPKLPKAEKEQIQFRLDNIDLTMEELIDKQVGK